MSDSGLTVGDRILQSSDSHPDWCAAYGRLGSFQFIGASAIGKLHIDNSRPRDDAFAVRTAGVWLAVAVSDGVGSRALSRYGASFCVEALCEQLLREAKRIECTQKTEMKQAPSVGVVSGEAEKKELSTASLSSSLGVEITTQSHQESEETNPKEVSLILKAMKYFSRSQKKPVDAVNTSQKIHAVHTESPLAGTNSRVMSSHPDIDTAVAPICPTDEITVEYGTLAWRLQPPTQDTAIHGANAAGVPGEEHNPFEATHGANPIRVDVVRRAFEHTYSGLEQFVKVRGFTLNDVSCTLLGFIINTETGEVLAGHIGDGLIATYDPVEGARSLLDPPIPDEVGTVHAFTKRDWADHLALQRFVFENNTQTYYLMTDGVSEDCTHPPPEDIFRKWSVDIDREMRKEEPLSQRATRLLRWLAKYEAPGSWDDRTLVVIMRSGTDPNVET